MLQLECAFESYFEVDDIFCGSGDRLKQKMYLYVDAYNVLCSVLYYSGISCAGDRLARKLYLYIESYQYAEAYDILWNVLL